MPPDDLIERAIAIAPSLDPEQLRSVLRELGDTSEAGAWVFLTTGKGSLGGRTPLIALADGDLEAVLRTARGAAER